MLQKYYVGCITLIISLNLFNIGCTNSIQPKPVYTNENVTHWKQSDSPIYIDSLLSITENDTLIIEPGVNVIFKCIDIDYNNSSEWNSTYSVNNGTAGILTVRGTIIANGTKDKPIVFSGNGEGSWGGIFLQNSKFSFRYCNIDGAIGLNYDDDIPTVYYTAFLCLNSIGVFDKCTIDSDRLNSIVALDHSDIVVSRCKSYKKMVASRSKIIIENNLFIEPGVYCLMVALTLPESFIVNNTFICNLGGLQLISAYQPEIYNNIFFNLTEYCIDYSNEEGLIYENNIWHWTEPVSYFIPLNFSNMDPIFVDPENGDYSLSPNSPARNLGKIDIDGYTFPEIDYSGNPRIIGISCDLGCYELIE